ncbi:metal ABC transporter ATP-binding protein [Goodfellowiella coeruleoviolacea]|uniref:Zinc/manganese transport system ATP-binding protein n=1 Tax=Goodfellowiella coeruleoviolacea TaxID=334858 RepID=A0AAE3GAT8_9PSEU|nr:ATP-binding cassette domain-containing protein [Goodfellowiella coeruleoviolacea]MCP2164710.1 zinc/manganese transport system ATP-binding protein [Goodfellowiella coeruleoviolacea]
MTAHPDVRSSAQPPAVGTTAAGATAGQPATAGPAADRPAVALRGAELSYGTRVLWSGLDLDIAPGEFLAVLGPNGSGKTSLLRVLLGQQELSAGSVTVAGGPPGRGSRRIGYIPQQKAMSRGLTLRGRDLVGLGLDGHRWGIGLRNRRDRARRVDQAVAAVGATGYADQPVGLLSGGEQQRLRVAQALVGDPEVLLCDEPLLSLDLAHQRAVSELIDARRRAANTAVLFVTHEINPVLPLVDRVLYLVDGRFRVGTPDEVMTSETLSELYRTHIDVVRVRGQIVVVGAQGAAGADQPHHPMAATGGTEQ